MPELRINHLLFFLQNSAKFSENIEILWQEVNFVARIEIP